MADAFARQGFASREIVTRWADIVGDRDRSLRRADEDAVAAQPGWRTAEPATLVLRVQGPAALEIQHQSSIILERVNRFFGWQAVGRLALRQAPLTRRKPRTRPSLDPAAAARVEARLGAIEDADLRHALGRLGAAVKRT